jgi:basic membrane protein A and related proteins
MACGTGEPADRAGARNAAGRPFRIALLTPGPISDRAWNGSAYDGLIRLRDSLGAAISHVQVRTPAEFEENFRQYGEQDYSLVIGHGFEFQDAAARVSADYPRTIFLTTGGETVRQNVAALSFAFDEPSFLAGMAAAAASRTGMVGSIGGTELPPVRTSFTAFASGARLVNPNIRVLTAYIGNWEDMSAGKEQAVAFARRGVDVIFQNADAAGLGIFQAAREGRGLLVIGANANQNDIAPEFTLGSVVIDLPRAFDLVAREVSAGTFTARVFRLGLREGVVRWEPGRAYEPRVPQVWRDRIDSVASALLSLPAPVRPSPAP